MQKTITVLLAVLCTGGLSLKAQNAATTQADTLYVTLNKALEIALSENPTIKIADQEIKRMNYAKSEAYGNLSPTVAFTGSFSRNLMDNTFIISKEDGLLFTIPASNTINGGFSVNVPLFSMGIYKNIQLAEINIKSALEASRGSKIALKNEIEKAYYGILMAHSAYNVTDASLKNAEGSYNNIKLKYEEGRVAEFDMLRAEVQVSNIRPSFLQAKNSLQLAYLQLKMLMGIPVDVPLKVEGQINDYENDYKSHNQDVLNYSLANNSDLKMLTFQEQALQKQLQLQKTARMPYLGASFSYMFNTQDPSFNILHYTWFDTPTVGLTLNVPIFSGLVNRNKEKQISSGITQLQLQRQYQETGLNVNVRNAIITMENAIELIEASINSIRQAQKAYDISKTRYDSGMSTLVELNDAEVALTQSKLNHSQAIYSYLLAKSDYIKLLGNDF